MVNHVASFSNLALSCSYAIFFLVTTATVAAATTISATYNTTLLSPVLGDAGVSVVPPSSVVLSARNTTGDK